MIQIEIDKVLSFFNLKSETTTINFTDNIPKNTSGVYVIYQGDTIIYVGKGKSIKDRNETHKDKAFRDADKTPFVYIPEAWKFLRENYEKFKLDPNFWQIKYVILNYETERTAVEGALIYFLNPIANDEVFSDPNLKGKNEKMSPL